jgi:gliding motility-associated-like protein
MHCIKILKNAFLSISILLSYSLHAQNLVNNPSFESVNLGSLQCSWYLSQATFNAAINQWTVPTPGTTDIFHSSLAISCFCNPLSTDPSAVGQQTPRTGSCMTALCTYGNGGCSPWREYVQGSLSSAMVPGQPYCVEFYVSLADNSIYAANNIGVYFTTSAWTSATGGCPYYVTPQVNYTGIITNKTVWTLISLTFTPTQAYTYFTIGNFYNDPATSVINVGGTSATNRYFLDDVDIHLCSSNPIVTTTGDNICVGETATITASSNIAGTTFSWSSGGSGSSINVTPVVTTTYTVTGTAPSGGTDTEVATVTVYNNPTVTAAASTTPICAGQSTTITALGASTYSWNPGGLSGSSVIVSPLSTTTYTVTGTSVNGCTGTAMITVSVNNNPTVSITAGTNPICPGSSTTLTANGATTYVWSGGLGTGNPITVSPASTTTYTVTGTSSGCTGTAAITVNVNANLTVSIAASANPICAGSSATLTANGATIYAWSGGLGTANPITVTPALTTTYTVTGTTTGCTGTAAIMVTVNPNPVVTPVATPSAICNGSSSSLNVTSNIAGTTYDWMPGSLSGTPVSVSPGTSTTYTVTGTAAGCTGSATVLVTVNPNPVVTPTATPATICDGSSTSLSVTSAVAGTTFSWMPGSLSGTPVSVSPGTSTTYTVTGTAAGCTGSATVMVTVNPNPIITSTATPAAICDGSSTSLNVTSTIAGTTFLWMPGSLNGTPVIVTPNSSTTYTVTGTAAGCTGSATLLVTVNPNPVLTPLATPATICIGESTSLGVTSSVAGTTFSWMPGNLIGTPVSVSPSTTTTYTVTGTAAGCIGSTTLLVTVNPNLVLTPTATPATICNGETSMLSVTSTVAGTTFSWMPGSLTGTPVSVTPSTTTTYTVTGTASGCTGSSMITVTVNQSPVITPTAMPASICIGESASISAISSIVGTSFTWMPGNLNGTPVSVTPAATTTYTVTGTAAGCTGTANVTVTINSNPVMSVIAIPDTLCPGQSAVLTASGASTYSWIPGNLSGSAVTVQPTQSTTYIVTGNNNGCTGEATINVFVYNETQVLFDADTKKGCEDLLVNFYDLSGYPDAIWLWNFGDGAIDLQQNPSHLYTDAGDYNVSLTVIPPNGCSGTLIIPYMISVYPIPIADFSLNPQFASIENPEISFFDHSLNATSWFWDFGDPASNTNNSMDQSPDHIYSDTGTFVVTLIVSSQGCFDTAKHSIEIQPTVDVFIPNAFTPGTDGLNNYFSCIGNGINESTFKMRIFDRWGEEIFFSDNSEPGWDGTYKGKLVATGTYIYLIDFVDVTFNEHHYKGIVNVVR